MGSGWYLLADLAIILVLIAGVWQFRTPRRALTGNLTAAFALICAVGVVLYRNPISGLGVVLPVLVLGSLAGWVVAIRVNMLQIPAMVAFLNGAGGAAAFLVSLVKLTRDMALPTAVGRISGILGIVIGAATFSGSMIASAKLANCMKQTPTIFPRHDWILSGTVAAAFVLGIASSTAAGSALLYCLLGLALLSLLLGIVFSIRVGGADMPVLISFLNTMTGLAAALCGIIMQNRLLIACGATVAASGAILTRAMCKAMNRKLFRVFTGIRPKLPGMSAEEAADKAGEAKVDPGPSSEAQEPGQGGERDPLARAIEVMKSAKSVVVIPGYGMALAQAQFELVRLAGRLEQMGKDVKFAIHPVAGRMPGHMNVLLAEAEVDYDKLFEMDDVNRDFKETDLALVVGACDVVNPAAIRVEGTPISGMPILLAHEAKNVVVCNLDQRPGYSGVENPLYKDPKTILLLGDAKTTIGQLVQGLG